MDSRHFTSLTEAYLAVYDEDLREDLFEEEEDFSFMDDLSDNELVYIMEQIILEGRYTLEECLDVFEGEYLFESEARERRRAAAGQKRKEAFQKATRPARAMGRLALGRLKKAATKAGENIKAGVESAKKYGSEKVASAKKKIGGFIDRARVDAAAAPGIARRTAGKVGARIVHKAAEAGRGAALKAADKLGRVAYAAHERGGSSSLRKTLKGSGSSSAPSKSSSNARDTTHSGGGVGRREAASSGGIRSRGGSMGSSGSQGRSLTGSSVRGQLPPARATSTRSERVAKMQKRVQADRSAPTGGRGQGLPPVGVPSRTAALGEPRSAKTSLSNLKKASKQGAARMASMNSEEFDYFLSTILEDLIQEGYAYDYDDAFDLIESLSDYEFDDLMESYLEEDDSYDVYDMVIEHLIDEGYADTFEDAEAIMVNMSEDWRENIVERVSVPRASSSTYRETSRRPTINTVTGNPVDKDPNSPEEIAKRERRQRRGKMEPVQYRE